MTTTSEENPVFEAARLGHSFWYDTLDRRLLTSGELARMVESDGLRGVTSNPTIFEKAMTGSDEYRASLPALWARGITDPKDVYESLAIDDIRAAADLLHRFYVESDGRDGYVSLEASPHLAHDTAGTIAEARRLFRTVGRDNVMIKVPGTPEGIEALARLIGEGININMTLLFGLQAYEDCAEAYLAGLERRAAAGGDLRRLASVASFFLSRIDDAVDRQITSALATTPLAARRTRLGHLLGRVAIANAKLASQRFQEMASTPRWQALAGSGARPQRLLWASTGPKNPAHPKTYYVDALVGPDSISTVPAEVWQAFLAHGRPRVTVTEQVDEARETLQTLAEEGISLDGVTDKLLEKGIETFAKSFDAILTTLERQRLASGADQTAHP
jgi:transaldolase / glucose-6-phosphate isomerase